MGEAAWVFFLEAGLALALLIFIVWWTMGSRAELQQPADDASPGDKATDAPPQSDKASTGMPPQ